MKKFVIENLTKTLNAVCTYLYLHKNYSDQRDTLLENYYSQKLKIVNQSIFLKTFAPLKSVCPTKISEAN